LSLWTDQEDSDHVEEPTENAESTANTAADSNDVEVVPSDQAIDVDDDPNDDDEANHTVDDDVDDGEEEDQLTEEDEEKYIQLLQHSKYVQPVVIIRAAR